MRGILRQVTVVLSLSIMLYTNLLLGSGDLESEGKAGIYAAYQTAFTPAPYTFAIWGVIFLGCISFAVFQALPVNRNNQCLNRISEPIVVAFLSNALTPLTPIGLSNVVIVVLLIALILSYRRVTQITLSNRAFWFFVRTPITLFLGWITIATILNFCQLVVSFGGSVNAMTASVLILLATAIGLFMLKRWHEFVFAIVLIWAFWGIVVANSTISLIWTSAIIGTSALTLLSILSFSKANSNALL